MKPKHISEAAQALLNPAISTVKTNRLASRRRTQVSRWLAITGLVLPVVFAGHAAGFVVGTENEFLSTGDFNNDGRPDFVIVEKQTGKYRLGYQSEPGVFQWATVRESGIEGVSGLAVGKLFNDNHDALAFTSADLNQLNLADVSEMNLAKPVVSVTPPALGPAAIAAVQIGRAESGGLHDLWVASIYNVPSPNQASLLQNKSDGNFAHLGDFVLPGEAIQANRVALKAGQPEILCVIYRGDEGSLFRAEDLKSGQPEAVLAASGLPDNAKFAVGHFGGSDLAQFIFFEPGSADIQVRAVVENAPGKYELAAAKTFSLGQPVLLLQTLPENNSTDLLVLFDTGEKGAIYTFDGQADPVSTQPLAAPEGEIYFGAGVLPAQFALFSGPMAKTFAASYKVYNLKDGKASVTAEADLPTLDEGVLAVRARVLANQTEKSEADMSVYTNTIPGTQVNYVMMPIHGGEFVMGSPVSEPGHQPDESPQHKVKVSPFWMGRCEVTWDEFELFMYPTEERKYRTIYPTDAAADVLADAVTHPTKPYTEMSFGMGKAGYPAIAMTQHAANKYCEWLSAKTGQFYRLPTEAEWEYACRAGTTTAYFFGDDPAPLENYAWYGKNSDWKYQKVGRKKPSPWGLCDIYGNVLEWTLDQYSPDYYKKFENTVAVNPWNRATQPYPHAARGGSWDDDDPLVLRSAARRASDRSWKMQDPQLPKSVWYFSDAQFIGFRIVRPLEIPSPEMMFKYWNSGVERD